MRGVVALAIFWVVEPIGKGIDGAATGSSARESAEPMSKSKSLPLPVQSTQKNPNAAPAIKEPQKTTVSRERDAPGGRHVAPIRRGRAERSTLQNLTFCAGPGKGRPEIGHPIRRAGMDAETGTTPQIDESAPVSAFDRLRDKIPAPMKKSP